MTAIDDIWAVVPVKEPDAAKQRLSGADSAGFRRGLARAMLEDVVSTVAAAPGLAGLALVTVDAEAAALGRRYYVIFEDGARDGHTGAVTVAGRRLQGERRRGMLTVPADIPLVTAAEIAKLLAAHRSGRGFSIVPAHDRRGSNAIVLTPPDAVKLAFGNDSFLPHLDAARLAGIAWTNGSSSRRRTAWSTQLDSRAIALRSTSALGQSRRFGRRRVCLELGVIADVWVTQPFLC
jgi:2-phospho-L-lactate guanylyltransferase